MMFSAATVMVWNCGVAVTVVEFLDADAKLYEYTLPLVCVLCFCIAHYDSKWR